MLELVGANPYTVRAYRRAAETIPVAELARSGRVREVRGIGPGIEARLRALVETGEIAELAALERELAPNLVGLVYLGLSPKRSVELARLLGVRTADERRKAAAEGRLQSVPGDRAEDRGAAARGACPRGRAATAPRTSAHPGWELVGGIAAALGGEAGGDVRRWRDCCQSLAVVCRAADPRSVLARFAELPQIVAMIEQDDRRAVGVTLDGVPIELDAAEPNRFVAALVRATGRPHTSQRSSRYLTRPTRRRSTGRSAFPGVRRSCARRGSAANRRPLLSRTTSAATCTATRLGRTEGLAS